MSERVGFSRGGFSSGGGGAGAAAAGGLSNVSPMVLSPFSPIYSIGNHTFANQNAVQTLASGVVGAANRAMAWPFWLPTAVTYTHAWIQNGATVAGNLEIGVYNLDLTKHTTTGSFAQAGTSTLQVQATTFTLAAGSYFLWVSASDATATVIRDTLSSAPMANCVGMFQQDAVGPGSAPSTATPATVVSNIVYVCGLSVRTL